MDTYRIQESDTCCRRITRFGAELRQTVLNVVLVAGMLIFLGGWLGARLGGEDFTAPQGVHAAALAAGVGSVAWTCVTAFTHIDELRSTALNGSILWLLLTLALFGATVGVNTSYIDHCSASSASPAGDVNATSPPATAAECPAHRTMSMQFAGAGIAAAVLFAHILIAMAQARQLEARQELLARVGNAIQAA